jgi:DNA-binding response OmpR family regulator
VAESRFAPPAIKKIPSVTEKRLAETNLLLISVLVPIRLNLSTGTEVPGLEFRRRVKRILLICPDLALTEELAFFLRHSGFQVANAVESGQVLAEVDRSGPDLILMRQNSHRLNGDHLCIRIREVSDVPIIVLGQNCDETEGVEMLEMGADAYLTTPLNPRELLARIRALLRRSRVSRLNTEADAEVWK